MALGNIQTTPKHKPLSVNENLEKVKNHVKILKEDLRSVDEKITESTRIQLERGDLVISHGNLLNTRLDIDFQIRHLEEILTFVEDKFDHENDYIRNTVASDLSRLADLEMIPRSSLTKRAQEGHRYTVSREIRAAKLRLNKLTAIKIAHLKDTVDEESWLGNKRAKTLRDVVEFGIVPSSKYSNLNKKGKQVVDRGLDLIAAQYLDENFNDFIVEKRKKRSKWNPDQIKTGELKSAFNKHEFIKRGFDMSVQDFTALVSRSFENADAEVLEVFATYPLSVKLQGRTTLVASMKNKEKKHENKEHIVKPKENMGMIVYNLMDNPPISQAKLSGRIAKLPNLPILNIGDIVVNIGDIYTHLKPGEKPYRFKVWPNNGNVVKV